MTPRRTSRIRLATSGLAAALLALLAACSSSSKSTPTSSSGAASSATSGASSAASSSSAAASSAPAAGSGHYVIGVSNTIAGNGWREEMICSIKAQALASGNVSKVVVISKNGGPTDQIQDLQNLISQGVNAIIVNPSDPEKLNSVLEAAVKKGIVVVAVDQQVTAPDVYIAANNQEEYGKLGAQWLAKALNGKGDVLYMRGAQGAPADIDRDRGFRSVMSQYPGIKFKEVYTGWDFTKAASIATQELTAHHYDGIWTSGTDYTVVNAFKTLGKTPIPVVGADNNAFVAQLLAGQPGAAVTNPAAVGAVGLDIALQALEGKNPPKKTFLTPEVWDLATAKDKLEQYHFPNLPPTWPSEVEIKPWTTYTPQQLIACKGPGE